MSMGMKVGVTTSDLCSGISGFQSLRIYTSKRVSDLFVVCKISICRYAFMIIAIHAGICIPVKSASIISAICEGNINVLLSISEKEVVVERSVSQNNLESLITLNDYSKPGSTAIFYGGQSKYFRSYDESIYFAITVGHGESRQISNAWLRTKSGDRSCAIK